MRNPGHHPGFALEGLDEFLVGEVLWVEDFKGDDAVEGGVVGTVDSSKTAVTELFKDFKFPYSHGCHSAAFCRLPLPLCVFIQQQLFTDAQKCLKM